jgi:hypothetical protein
MIRMGSDAWYGRLFAAADEPAAEAGDWDYAVGDLQVLFPAAFGLLTPAQRRKFLDDPEVRTLAEDVPE